jgi:xylulokinase
MDGENMVILAVDIGTSNFKAAIFSYDGECAASVSLPLSFNAEGGSFEIDPRLWLGAFSECCLRLGSLSKVEALVISGNGPTLVPVTGDIPQWPEQAAAFSGTAAVPPARLWLDRRALEEARTVSAAAGDFVDAGFFLPKALMIKNREPALYEKTAFFLYCPEYLAYMLTGAARTIFPSEGFERWYWTEEVLATLGLDGGKFPPFVFPGDVIGMLSGGMAERFGFSKAVPVMAGGPDFFVAILGSGAVSPGQVCDRSGTSEGINACTEKKIDDRRLMSYGHPVKPWWNLSGIISTTGKAVEWAAGILGFSGSGDFYGAAAASAPGAGGLIFLPYLAGERAPIWDSQARGVFYGLSHAASRSDLARAAAEGICFAIRDVIEVMEEAGAAIRELRVTGGTARSGVLNQIKADILGKDVIAAEEDAELAGLAALGAAALGKYKDSGEAVSAMIRQGKTCHPEMKNAELYRAMFSEYRSIYRSLRRE